MSLCWEIFEVVNNIENNPVTLRKDMDFGLLIPFTFTAKKNIKKLIYTIGNIFLCTQRGRGVCRFYQDLRTQPVKFEGLHPVSM